MVTFSTCNTNIYKVCKAIFSAFYNISPAKVATLLILGSSFKILFFLPGSNVSLSCKLSIAPNLTEMTKQVLCLSCLMPVQCISGVGRRYDKRGV